jgi:hypothetical protein
LDLGGLSSIDIAVPTWAKAAQLIGFMYPGAGGNYPVLRVSADGTNFIAGASDYAIAGATHNTGTSAYQTSGQSLTNSMWLGLTGDNAALPHMFTAEINLQRPNTSTVFGMKVYAKALDPLPTTQHRTAWWSGFPANAATSSLVLKTLRILGTSGGPFGPNSMVLVRWIGAAPAPANPGIVSEAPQDGKSYERKNGLWIATSPQKLVDSFLSADSPNFIDIPLPAGYKRFKAILRNFEPTTVANSFLIMRASADGLTPVNTGYTWAMTYESLTNGPARFDSSTPTPSAPTSFWVLGPTAQPLKVGVASNYAIDIEGQSASYNSMIRWTGAVITSASVIGCRGEGRVAGVSPIRGLHVAFNAGSAGAGAAWELWGYL